MTKGQIFRFHDADANSTIEAFGFRGDTMHIGYGNSGLYDTYMQGNNIVFRSGNRVEALHINPSGNVGIGISNPEYKLHIIGNTFISGFVKGTKFFTKENYGLWRGNSYSASLADTDVAYNATKHIFAGGNVLIGTTTDSGYKLDVNGSTLVNSIKSSAQHPTLGNVGGGGHLVVGNANLGLEIWTRSDGHSGMQAHRHNGEAHAFNLLLQPLGGNVGIGTTTPQAKLHVAGDIFATGEIAAGGVAEEGSVIGGNGKKWSHTFNAANSATQTFTHSLNEEDVIVNLYERDAYNQKWQQILADVTIEDANSVSVTFGSTQPSNTQFMIVVMG